MITVDGADGGKKAAEGDRGSRKRCTRGGKNSTTNNHHSSPSKNDSSANREETVDGEGVIVEDVVMHVAGRKGPLRGNVWKSSDGEYIQYKCVDDGVIYRPGDAVYIESQHSDQPYFISSIQDFKKSKRDHLMVHIKWFYRPSEVPETVYQLLVQDRNTEHHWESKISKDPVVRSRELFISDAADTYPVSVLRGVCRVFHLADIAAVKGFSPIPDSFFYVLGYNPETRRLASTQGEIRVGPSHQARLPELRAGVTPGQMPEKCEDREEPKWRSGLTGDGDLLMYLRAARSMAAFAGMCDGGSPDDGCFAASRDDTTINALDVLHQSRYDPGKALQALVKCPVPKGIDKKWTDEETKRFVKGLRQFGKDFFRIRIEFLPHKETADLVEFYYLWKKTPGAKSSRPHRRQRIQNTLKRIRANRTNKNQKDEADMSSASEEDNESEDSDSRDGNGYRCKHCLITESRDWHHAGKDKILLCSDCRLHFKKYGELPLTKDQEKSEGDTENDGDLGPPTPPPADFLFRPVKEDDSPLAKSDNGNHKEQSGSSDSPSDSEPKDEKSPEESGSSQSTSPTLGHTPSKEMESVPPKGTKRSIDNSPAESLEEYPKKKKPNESDEVDEPVVPEMKNLSQEGDRESMIIAPQPAVISKADDKLMSPGPQSLDMKSSGTPASPKFSAAAIQADLSSPSDVKAEEPPPPVTTSSLSTPSIMTPLHVQTSGSVIHTVASVKVEQVSPSIGSSTNRDVLATMASDMKCLPVKREYSEASSVGMKPVIPIPSPINAFPPLSTTTTPTSSAHAPITYPSLGIPPPHHGPHFFPPPSSLAYHTPYSLYGYPYPYAYTPYMPTPKIPPVPSAPPAPSKESPRPSSALGEVKSPAQQRPGDRTLATNRTAVPQRPGSSLHHPSSQPLPPTTNMSKTSALPHAPARDIKEFVAPETHDGGGEDDEDIASPAQQIPRGPSPEPKVEDSECHRSESAIFLRHWNRGEGNSCARTDLTFKPVPDSKLARKREERLRRQAEKEKEEREKAAFQKSQMGAGEKRETPKPSMHGGPIESITSPAFDRFRAQGPFPPDTPALRQLSEYARPHGSGGFSPGGTLPPRTMGSIPHPGIDPLLHLQLATSHSLYSDRARPGVNSMTLHEIWIGRAELEQMEREKREREIREMQERELRDRLKDPHWLEMCRSRGLIPHGAGVPGPLPSPSPLPFYPPGVNVPAQLERERLERMGLSPSYHELLSSSMMGGLSPERFQALAGDPLMRLQMSGLSPVEMHAHAHAHTHAHAHAHTHLHLHGAGGSAPGLPDVSPGFPHVPRSTAGGSFPPPRPGMGLPPHRDPAAASPLPLLRPYDEHLQLAQQLSAHEQFQRQLLLEREVRFPPGGPPPHLSHVSLMVQHEEFLRQRDREMKVRALEEAARGGRPP